MKNSKNNRVCKNKKCQKPLPDDYKFKYCEACRNQQAGKAKQIMKIAGAGAAAVGAVALAIVTGGKVNLKK